MSYGCHWAVKLYSPSGIMSLVQDLEEAHGEKFDEFPDSLYSLPPLDYEPKFQILMITSRDAVLLTDCLHVVVSVLRSVENGDAVALVTTERERTRYTVADLHTEPTQEENDNG
jgi:hypothetical protein